MVGNDDGEERNSSRVRYWADVMVMVMVMAAVIFMLALGADRWFVARIAECWIWREIQVVVGTDSTARRIFKIKIENERSMYER